MKKVILANALIFILLLTSCSKSEFVNLAGFTEDYSNYEKLEPQSFVYYVDENSNTVYQSIIEEANEKILLSLHSKDGNRLYECRVTMSKVDKKGKKKELSNIINNLFSKVCINTVSSFTGKSQVESNEIVSQLGVLEKCGKFENTESVKEIDNFVFILLTDEICSELVVKNKWFCEIETTQKPENKNNFAEVTSIRTETVPHS